MNNQEPKSQIDEPSTSVDLENKNSCHSLAIELTGRDKLVLAVGTSTDYITKILNERGNKIIGIEIDEDVGERSSKYCESMIIGDIEEIDLDKHLEISSLDVVLFGDVLEHLKWPELMIKKINKYIKLEGYLVVFLPNICHRDFLINLLEVDLKYNSTGLRDETHLGYFGIKNVINILDRSGSEIVEFHTMRLPIAATKQKLDLSQIPQESIKSLKTLSYSEVYQFVFKAVPSKRTYDELASNMDLRKASTIGVEDLTPQYQDNKKTLFEQLQQANNHALAQSQEISQLMKDLEERNNKITVLTEELLQANHRTTICIKKIKETQKSIVWRTTMKFQKDFVEKALPNDSIRRRQYDLGLKGGRILFNGGIGRFWHEFKRHNTQNNISHNEKQEPTLHIQANELNTEEIKILMEDMDFRYRPKISIITPVWNTDIRWLCTAIDSVLSQVYDNWELCLADGGSENKSIKRILKDYANRDSRIRVKFLKQNKGISGNSNEALALSKGDFVGFLDHDDVLAPFALHQFVRLLNKNPQLDFIYSDEDKIDENGILKDPFFKPDWSPDTFLSFNYIVHMTIIRANIIKKIGGFHNRYDGSQDYDLFLRALEHTDNKNIAHIPKILYHRRMVSTSLASPMDSKPYAYIAAKEALKDAMERRNIQIDGISDGYFLGSYKVNYKVKDDPEVTIIIPNRDNVDALRNCIESIIDKTQYANYMIKIVENNSIEENTFKYYKQIEANARIKILRYDKPFNYSAINNFAVSQCDSEYILFLNNDTEILSNEWLTVMLELAQREDIGAVGAKLVFPNNSIQHCGVIVGSCGAAHPYYGCQDQRGYFGEIGIIRNVSAVTAACMLTKKYVFEEVGGFDEKEFVIAFNDVDYCLKLRERGYLIVYTPYARLIHYESLTRGKDDIKQTRFQDELNNLCNRWSARMKSDPYFNINLTIDPKTKSIKIK